MEVTIEQEINHIQMERPHVVILGAGASVASFPRGDKYGRGLPIMDNFISVLGIENLLSQTGISYRNRNFEAFYDELCQQQKKNHIRRKLESTIYDYFAQLVISDEPTVYDHLLLSLRAKDVVATFNWDPLLVQAYRRNGHNFELPRILFLHGNVKIGICEKDDIMGAVGNSCSKCGTFLKPTKLLYPIAKKNYHTDAFISSQWNELKSYLKCAFMVTLFGYGKPQSDVSAIELMKSAWGNVEQRVMEQTEIIDVKEEDELCKAWEPFIHTHHYEIHASFYDSWIANHPRRTGEAYFNTYVKGRCTNNNPIPRDCPFKELWAWFDKLKRVEEQQNNM